MDRIRKTYRALKAIPYLRPYGAALLSAGAISLHVRFGVLSLGPSVFLGLVALISAIEEHGDRRA